MGPDFIGVPRLETSLAVLACGLVRDCPGLIIGLNKIPVSVIVLSGSELVLRRVRWLVHLVIGFLWLVIKSTNQKWAWSENPPYCMFVYIKFFFSWFFHFYIFRFFSREGTKINRINKIIIIILKVLRNNYVMMTQSNYFIKKVMIHNNLSKTL